MAYIRYFATNRDRENLGRDVSRSDRLKMQKGGYNWIDTKAYMSYYLAETNPDKMPREALIESSKEPIFDNFLRKESVKRILICIHGFNVPLHGALTSFTVLANTLESTDELVRESAGSLTASMSKKLNIIVDPTLPDAKEQLNQPTNDLTAVVGFSWPSNGKTLDYNSDRTEAAVSAPVLANLISNIRSANRTAKIFVIAHSMGNFLTCTMLNDLAEEKYTPNSNENEEKDRLKFRRDKKGTPKKFFIDGYFMLAPDVERRHVTKCYKRGEPSYETEDFSKEDPKKADDSASENVYYLGPFFEGLHHLVGGVYLFYSRHDQALQFSKVEKEVREHQDDIREFFSRKRNMENLWEDSLGLNPAPPLAPPNMYSFNASTLSNMQIDHGNYFDVVGIAQKIAHNILTYKDES